MPIPRGYRRKKIVKSWRRSCAPGSIRTVKSGKARVLICCPKGKFSRGRCKVGTRAIAIDKPRFGEAGKMTRAEMRAAMRQIIRDRPKYVEPDLLPMPAIKKFKAKGKVNWNW